MFRTVLVPLDGSRLAEAALPVAVRLVRDAGAKLHLVLIHEPVVAVLGMNNLAYPSLELESELRDREHSYLATAAADLSAVSGEDVGLHEVDGAAGPAICEEAGRIGADLVVMATHGRGTFGRIWLGSVADYVVRHLAVPILLVHLECRGKWPCMSPLRGILVALDLSRNAEAILEPVIALARMTRASLTLAHISEVVLEIEQSAMPVPLQQGAELLEASRVAAQERLDRTAVRVRKSGLNVATRAIIGAGAASGLLDALEEDQFDLIAMTTHGYSGMQRLLLGSVADKVIRGATKPVLVMRPERPVS